MSGAVPPPAARPLGRAAGVPRPVCPRCGRCGREDPALAPQRAPLRAGVAHWPTGRAVGVRHPRAVGADVCVRGPNLATMDMVAPVSSTPRYSRTPRRIRTKNNRSVGPPERPCKNSAGQVTSNPFFWSLRAMRMKRQHFRSLDWSPSSLARLVPCSCLPCVWEWVVGPVLGCSPEGPGFPPGVGFRFPPDGFAFLSLSGLRSPPPRRALPLPLWPLPFPLDLSWRLSLLEVPFQPPLPLAFSVLSFSDRRCLW